MFEDLLQQLRSFIKTLRDALKFLGRRMGALRLPQVAGSLSYTTALSVVPLLVIVLSILTILPQFQGFQKEIQNFMTENLMPARMSKMIMQQITIFVERSSRLSLIGGIFLIISALSTMAIIDRAFDDIWQIKQRTSFRRNVMTYWGVLTLGPFIFGGALLLINYLMHSPEIAEIPILGSVLSWMLPFALSVVCFAALYVFVPKRKVEWRDALIGGFVAAVIFLLLSKTFSAIFKVSSGYAILYGAFSIIPAFFLWLYVFWLGILLGAGITANLPILKYERWRREARVGDRLPEALTILHHLYQTRRSPARMMSWEALQQQVKLNSEELALIMERLQQLGWVGKIKRTDSGYGWALIADEDEVCLSHVYDAFVFDTPYFANQAEQQNLPWASYLTELQHTPAHQISLNRLFTGK